MSDLTDQTAATTLVDADLLYAVRDVATTPVPRKITVANAKLALTADEATLRAAADADLDAAVDELAYPTVNVVAASGSTETLAWGRVHRVTMDQNCTFSFGTAPASGLAGSMTLILSGAFTPTWPASVDWSDATQPPYATPAIYEFLTIDGGTTVYGFRGGKAFG